MNLTLHLVAKDLRRLSRTSILWIILLIGQVAMSYRLVSTGENGIDWFQRVGMANDLLLGMGLVVTYLLIGMMVLEDPVAGEKMFWVTRPISGGRLLVAKIVAAVLLFGVLPIIIWIPWWLICDFSLGDMASAAIRMMSLQLIFAIPAFVVASLATSTGRFLLMSVVLAMGVGLAMINLIGPAHVGYALRITRHMSALIIIETTGIVGTILTYRTRQIGRVMIVIVIGTGLAALAAMKFPRVISNPLWRSEEVGQLDNSSQITVDVESAALETHQDNNYLLLKLRVGNLPDELGLEGGRANVILQWSDGTTVESASVESRVGGENLSLYRVFGIGGEGYRWPAHWDAETAAKNARLQEEIPERRTRSARPYTQIPEMVKDQSLRMIEMIPLTEEVMAKILKESPRYNVTIKISTRRPEVLGEISLVPDSVVTRHGRIKLLNFKPKLDPDARGGTQGISGTFSILQGPGRQEQVIFCLVDRLHHELGLLETYQTMPFFRIAGNPTWVGFNFTVPHVWRSDHWAEVPEWQKNVRIGMVVYKPAGTFDRTLKGDRLNLNLVPRAEMERMAARAPQAEKTTR